MDLAAVLASVKTSQPWPDYVKGLRRAFRKAGLEYQRKDFTINFPSEGQHAVFQEGPPPTYEIRPGLVAELGGPTRGGGEAKATRQPKSSPSDPETDRERRARRRRERKGRGNVPTPGYAPVVRDRAPQDVLNSMVNDLLRLLKVHIAEDPGKKTWLTFNAQMLYETHADSHAVAEYLRGRFAKRDMSPPTHLALMSIGSPDNYLIGFGPIEAPHAYHEESSDWSPVRDLFKDASGK